MSLNLSFKLLPILGIALGIASLVVPRFLNVFGQRLMRRRIV